MFAAIVIALSIGAYALIAANYRSIVAPALDSPEGRTGFANAMRPAFFAIVSIDALLLLVVGVGSYVLAGLALRPLVGAREREERFAADVAHELRTPLAAIASVAQAAAPSDPETARALATIVRRALEGSMLVGDLLILARSDRADAIACEPVDLARIVDRVLREYRAVDERPVIVATCGSAIVDADEARLEQLLRNLIENARTYARERIDVTLETSDGRAVLTIDDDGPGVASDIEARLFERFAKSASSSGSGLGLAICRWVANSHGGEIRHVGRARFVVSIPLADTDDDG